MKNIRILVLAAALVGTVGGLHAQSVVASGFCGKYVSNLSWVLTSDSVLRIYGSGDMHDYSFYYMDFPPWMDTSTYIYVIHVIIGDSVTSIGAEAFQGLDLTSITIGKGVTKINGQTISYGGAFWGCKNLTSITVHAVTPPIGVTSFNGVPKTASIYVPCGTIPAYQTEWTYFSNFIEEFADTISIFDTICQGDIYNRYGFNETEAGTHTQELQNRFGCDSTVILTLYVAFHDTLSVFDTIYVGDTYDKYGFNETATGIYTQELQNRFSCDSTVILYLTVNGVGIIEIAGQARNDVQGIEIYDILGRQYNVGANLCVRPNETLPAGIYFVRIQTNDRVIVKKIVINNK